MTVDVEVKAEDQIMEVIDVAKMAVVIEFGPLVVEAMNNVLEAKYFICSFYNVDLRKLADEH